MTIFDKREQLKREIDFWKDEIDFTYRQYNGYFIIPGYALDKIERLYKILKEIQRKYNSLIDKD